VVVKNKVALITGGDSGITAQQAHQSAKRRAIAYLGTRILTPKQQKTGEAEGRHCLLISI